MQNFSKKSKNLDAYPEKDKNELEYHKAYTLALIKNQEVKKRFKEEAENVSLVNTPYIGDEVTEDYIMLHYGKVSVVRQGDHILYIRFLTSIDYDVYVSKTWNATDQSAMITFRNLGKHRETLEREIKEGKVKYLD